MSFKYRFILSFVLLEIFFIILIVTVNFQAITSSSEKLISKQIDSNISFMKQLLKVPMSIYDIATLDNLVENSVNLGHINSLIILDSKDRVLSQSYNYTLEKIDVVLKTRTDTTVIKGDKSFELRYVEMLEDDTYLGSFYVVFDVSDNAVFIQENKERTLFIVLIEIILSTFLSYIIGSKLTQMLTRLSEIATDIGKNRMIEMPYLDKKDEIGILSNSMNQMQYDLKERNNKLKEFTSTLKKQKNELILANKSKDDFLANMSHELKTPLNSINVISSVMMKNKNKSLSEEQVKNMTIINSCGNDLLYLINDVLDLSKLEAGEIELHYETIDFKQLIEDIRNMFQPMIEEKGLVFDVQYDDAIHLVYTDVQRVKQIIKNLLSNALKFTQKGKISLSIYNENENIKISVQDEGIGIAKEKLEHIFDRFKQADNSTTRQFGGTGLGLSICKQLAALLQGKLNVTSSINHGSTFTLVLPKNEHRIEISIQNSLAQHRMRDIIVLNNNPIAMMDFIIALTKDFNVVQVSTVEELTQKIDQKSYEYIIIDLSVSQASQIEPLLEIKDSFLVFLYDKIIDEQFKQKGVKYFQKDEAIENIILALKE